MAKHRHEKYLQRDAEPAGSFGLLELRVLHARFYPPPPRPKFSRQRARERTMPVRFAPCTLNPQQGCDGSLYPMKPLQK